MQDSKPNHRFAEFIAPSQYERLDIYLSQLAGIWTRSSAARLIRDGLVSVNGKRGKASRPIHIGDRVLVVIPDNSPAPRAEEIPLTVLYEDSDVVVIDKPGGMVVHPAPGHSEHTLVNALLARYPGFNCGDTLRPGIVHRLDKDTSGIMIVALNNRARDWLISQFKATAVQKTYAALLVGSLEGTGIISGGIGRDPIHRKRMAVTAGGKPATTEYSVVEQTGLFTLVEAHPITGRTHQIRVHFAHIGHPVAGDLVYGKRQAWRQLEPSLPRQFLHASSLSIRLPFDTTETDFTSPLPAELQDALEAARRLNT